MKQASVNIALLFSALVISGCQQDNCQRGDASCNELANKHEYSILQVAHSQVGQRSENEPLIILRNVGESGKTALAFPSREDDGYVVMLADAEVSPRDKTIGMEDFYVTVEAIADLEASGLVLTPEIDRLISEMAETTG
ncbi:hypothetical protein [Aurantiacibacter sediminis]|uniref:Uncharacterized protein n=1 Tax=Aurantiacibacter sediminis TaxID=2793064 RepID=A0ABS0MZE7_9SPHN|nr:hypothetical protein [Aurantiacibacter sediminis]MBH5321083.1 hypothetical protein [Aurantiacibacter sediminis]